MKPIPLLTLISLLSIAPIHAAEMGYLVKVEGTQVFLDYGAGSGVRQGQKFVLYEEGDELIHPVTKKSLGRIEKKLGEGTISDVLQAYSIGTLKKAVKGLKPGQRARLVTAVISTPVSAAAHRVVPTASQPTRPPGRPAVLAEGKREPNWKSASFPYRIISAAYGDFNGDGGLETALADKKKVFLYDYPPKNADSKSTFKYPAVQANFFSLEAADINGNGKDELFISVHNNSGPRVETVVVELDANGQWKQLTVLPYLVRSHQNIDGNKVLATQQLLNDQTFPFSNIYPLTYINGKYARAKGAIRHKRVEWIYDFTTANLGEDSHAVIFHTKTDRLRVQLPKGNWRSSKAYDSTPVRLKWKNRILQARPNPQVSYGPSGFKALYLISNKARMAGWAKSFGLYASGELHGLRWDGVGMETAWHSDLSGYSTALSLIKTPRGSEELAVAVVGTSGRSSLWIYDL